MFSKQQFIDNTIRGCSYLVILTVILLPLMLFYYSIPLLKANSLYQLLFCDWRPDEKIYGLVAFSTTTIILGVTSTVISFFFGLSIALFINFHKKKLMGIWIKRIVVLMSGFPTVAYGFVGVIILVPFIRRYTSSPTGYSLLGTILMLSILILPTIVFYIDQSFNALPDAFKKASLSLGATKEQFYVYVLLPQSAKGIVTALILGFARAISDTMLALMISGNSFRFPTSVLESSRALTAHIALVLPGEFDGIEFKSIFFVALILFIFILIFNLLIQYINRCRA